MNFLRTHARSIIWLLIILAIPLTWYLKVYLNYQGDLAKYDLIDEQAEKYMRETAAEIAQYEANERADTYGGKTPQETWAMFVHALEVGDTDLAAKYFIQEKQEEMERYFGHAKEKNALGLFLGDFKTIIEERMQPDGKHFLYLTSPVEVDGRKLQGFTYGLAKSDISGIWKITEI